MSKAFFEVFPTLQLDGRKKTMLENTVIERVTSNARKNFLRVYLNSDHLLEKSLIFDIEKQIRKIEALY